MGLKLRVEFKSLEDNYPPPAPLVVEWKENSRLKRLDIGDLVEAGADLEDGWRPAYQIIQKKDGMVLCKFWGWKA